MKFGFPIASRMASTSTFPGQSRNGTPARGWWVLPLIGLMVGLAGFAMPVAGADAAAPRTADSNYDPRLGAPFTRRERAVLGAATAEVVVVEFSSFKCTHCRTFHDRIFPQLRKEYIDPGKVQWVVINASNDSADQVAQVFLIARGALRQGKYWEMAGSLFQVGLRPASDLADLVAKSSLLDRSELEATLRDPTLSAAVAADFAEYAQLKLRGTPTFLVRKLGRDGRWTGALIEDIQPLDYFQRVLDELLKTP